MCYFLCKFYINNQSQTIYLCILSLRLDQLFENVYLEKKKYQFKKFHFENIILKIAKPNIIYSSSFLRFCIKLLFFFMKSQCQTGYVPRTDRLLARNKITR